MECYKENIQINLFVTLTNVTKYQTELTEYEEFAITNQSNKYFQ